MVDSVLVTPLERAHERLGAAMTPFAGWRMPLRYSGEIAEHNAVRSAAGLFDLSHMGEITVSGPQAGALLDYALVGELAALNVGRARYTMICAPDGGVLDDLVVYRRYEDSFLVVANASNAALVYGELVARGKGFDAAVTDETSAYALIAIQGPRAQPILAGLTSVDLSSMKYYAGADGTVAGVDAWVARTGYTGEDGFEVYCAAGSAEAVWDALLSAGEPAGLLPAGLAARDTLRLEAGMALYGNELEPSVTPYEANLGRVVKLGKPGPFVGRDALAEREAAGPRQVLTGLVVRSSRRVPRHGYEVFASGEPCGSVTSGAPSPTLGMPIAMAYVAPWVIGLAEVSIDIRGSAVPAEIVSLPFYRRRQ